MKPLSLGLLTLKGFLLSCLFLMGSTSVSPCHEITQAEDAVTCDACLIAENSWSQEGVSQTVKDVIEVPILNTLSVLVNHLPKTVFAYKKPVIHVDNKDPILALRSSTLQLRI